MKFYSAKFYSVAMDERSATRQDRKARYVRTGEFRPPRAGEWYLSGAHPEAWKAPNDLGQSFHILAPVELLRGGTVDSEDGVRC